MKANRVLMALLVMCASGSLMSMDVKPDKSGRLDFLVDGDLCIVGYSKENMKFLIPAKDFLGKNIIDVANSPDREPLALGFFNAKTNKKTEKVPYSLDQKRFLATITALKGSKAEYFVKVQALNSANQ
jgi:hypothetical protein